MLFIVLLFESLHAHKPNDISAERLPNEDCRELDMCRIINSTDVENNAQKGGGGQTHVKNTDFAFSHKIDVRLS